MNNGMKVDLDNGATVFVDGDDITSEQAEKMAKAVDLLAKLAILPAPDKKG